MLSHLLDMLADLLTVYIIGRPSKLHRPKLGEKPHPKEHRGNKETSGSLMQDPNAPKDEETSFGACGGGDID